MFDWIKKLGRSGTNNTTPETQSTVLPTRSVKRIIPSSHRELEEEEPVQPPPPVAVTEPTRPSPISLVPKVEKPQEKLAPVPIHLTLEEIAPPPSPVPPPEILQNAPVTPAPVIRFNVEPVPLSVPEPVEEPVEPSTSEPIRFVRLAPAKKNPGLKLELTPVSAANREIVLTIGDFLSRIPQHFVRESEARTSQEVRFDAADLYSDMSKGRATIPLSVIAEALPNLFKRRLSAEEDIEVQLPLQKIVAQMGDLLTRPDQEQPDAFEEVDTPFLKAARRDQEIHKVSGAVAQPVPPSPAGTPAPAIPVLPSLPVIPISQPENTPAPTPKASPISIPDAPILPMASPRRDPAPALPHLKAEAPNKKQSRCITVRVRPLIQAMPIEKRDLLLGKIPEDSQVDLPLDEIEGQLASGRVFLPLATFSAALTESIRTQFTENFVGGDVPISLSEIVKNLPTDSMRMREDQHEQEVDPNEFVTPFNSTPGQISTKPVAPSLLQPVASPPITERARPSVTPVAASALANYTTRKLNNASGKFPSPMHAALGTQDPLDAKKVVKLASVFPGVASLSIITGDGLSLADNLPSFMDPEGFSAMAPQLHRKMASHTKEMKLGDLRHLSISTDTNTITIFTGDKMTIAVLHQNQSDLGHGVREKFVAIVDGLAKQYSTETTH